MPRLGEQKVQDVVALSLKGLRIVVKRNIFEILVDSGATLSAVRFKDKVGIPTSPVNTTVGASGALLNEPVAEPNVSVVESEVQHSFIIPCYSKCCVN